MRSMTGFGRGSVANDTFTIAVELKTVNNRFLDVNLRLPQELQGLEASLRRTIGSRLARGRVEVTLQYERTKDASFEIDRGLVRGYLAVMKEMQDEFGLAGEPDLNVIARLPNVVSTRREDPAPEFLAAVQSAFSAAIDDLDAMRRVEGEMLSTELSKLLASIESRLPAIADASALVADEYQARLSKRLTDMLSRSGSQIEIDQARLAQEVAYLADRADISEELARLRTHIEHFRSIMSDETDVGKRLDFLTQELNREANTIASKTGNVLVKENALSIKSDIEKIREQVQNVE